MNDVFVEDGIPIRQGIHEESLAAQTFVGRRMRLGDGRVFRYCKAGAALSGVQTIQGCVNYNKPYEGNRPETAYAIGDTKITVLTESGGNGESNPLADSYAGGFIWFQITQQSFYSIKGNTPTDGENQILTLDQPLKYALLAAADGGHTLWITIWPCIYGNVRPSSSGFESVVCKPLIPIQEGYYFWGQTWGPAFFQAGATAPGKTALYRNVVFGSGGAVLDGTGLNSSQHAGYVLSKTTTSDGDQMIMLQLAP